MEPAAESARGTTTRLGAIRSLATFLSRAIATVAAISTGAGLWLWLVVGQSATGSWFAITPELVLLLVVFLIPAGMLWFFWISIRSIQGLPEELRRVVSEGRLRSGELADTLRGTVPQPRWRRGVSIFRNLLELRTLLFRSRGVLVAAGLAFRLRVFNLAFLAGLLLAVGATAAMLVLAAVGTLLALLA